MGKGQSSKPTLKRPVDVLPGSLSLDVTPKISVFPRGHAMINKIKEQCTLWRHSVSDYVLKQLKHRKLCFVLEHSITPIRVQIAQESSASFRSSELQFENSMTLCYAL